MPKIVDHHQRREEIAHAFGRVIRREGLGGASVRVVAAEAGLSPGAMRHYFDRQEGLARFAFGAVASAVSRRIYASLDRYEGLDAVRVIEEAMPLDDHRLEEYFVWRALVVHRVDDPGIERITRAGYAGMDKLSRHVLREVGVSRPSAAQVRELHALVDGLSAHLALYPDIVTARMARRSLRCYVAEQGQRSREESMPAVRDASRTSRSTSLVASALG